jgi:hypothetical protein
MPSRLLAKLLERRLLASALIALVIAAVAALLSSSSTKIVSLSYASRKRSSNVNNNAP